MPAKPFVIALEEHFQDPDVGAAYGPLDANRAPPLVQRLEDLGERRIQEMDETGIDLQVISHSAPAMQKMTDAETAVRLARPRQRPAGGGGARASDPLCRLRRAADAQPEGRRRRVGTRRDAAWLQGRDDPWPDQRPFP